MPSLRLKGVLSMVSHMQWLHHQCVCTLGNWKHMDRHTPRGVWMLVYPHWCDSSCLHCFSGVWMGCWPFVDTCNGSRSIVILPHILWSKATTIPLGVCGYWCTHTGATVHVYTAFPGFVGGVDLFLTHAIGEDPSWSYTMYFDTKHLPYS
jgi:hypothetical protein